MTVFTNTASINVADMVYIDFGCQLNGNTKVVSSVAMSLEHLKTLHETFSKIISDVEEKQAERKRGTN